VETLVELAAQETPGDPAEAGVEAAGEASSSSAHVIVLRES